MCVVQCRRLQKIQHPSRGRLPAAPSGARASHETHELHEESPETPRNRVSSGNPHEDLFGDKEASPKGPLATRESREEWPKRSQDRASNTDPREASFLATRKRRPGGVAIREFAKLRETSAAGSAQWRRDRSLRTGLVGFAKISKKLEDDGPVVAARQTMLLNLGRCFFPVYLTGRSDRKRFPQQAERRMQIGQHRHTFGPHLGRRRQDVGHHDAIVPAACAAVRPLLESSKAMQCWGTTPSRRAASR